MGSSPAEYDTQYEPTEDTWAYEMALYMKIVQYFYISRVVLFTITSIVGIIGNGLVIWIAGFKMKTVSAVWFLNLAIADSISCLFLLLYIVAWTFPQLDEYILCIIRFFMLSLNMLTSVYFLMVISLDRCVSTMWPFWTRVHRRIKIARIISGVIWVFCLTSGFVYQFYHFNDLFDSECFIKRYLFSMRFQQPRQKYTTRTIVMFALPFTIILVSYSLVAFKIRARKRWHKSNRPFRVIIALVVCFFICWFPFHISSVLPDMGKTDRIPWKNVLKEEICLSLAYFNSCLNPIIYVFLSPEGRAKTLQNKMQSAMTGQYDLNDNDEINNTTGRTRQQCSSAL